jgi:hypothetical protein
VTNSTYQTGLNDASMSALPKRKAGSKLTSGHLLMILSGLLTFVLVIVILSAQGKTITVFVANDQIPVGQQITAANFTPTEIASSDLDSKYFPANGFDGDIKIFASRTIEKGEPLLSVAQNTKTSKSDTRLMTLPVAKQFAVNGALKQGDIIDIIETPENGCAFRSMTGLTIAFVSGGTSSGGITGGGDNSFILTIDIKNDGDDLILAGIIQRGQFQIVRTTGVDEPANSIEDTQCGSVPE